MVHGLLIAAIFAAAAQEGAPELTFERTRISAESIYESASAFDVNNDGNIDIFSGEFWWEGPAFTTKHKVCTIQRVDDYYDDFSNYPMDVNGDGYMDVITGGWFGETLAWRENPKGQPVEWTTHEIKKTGNVERPCFYDIDNDGDVEIIPNTKGVWIFKLIRDANGKGTGQFRETQILEEGAGHGIGYGDLNGDNRPDIILSHGWLEAPEDPYSGKWELHKDFAFGMASCPILAHDVNKDGKMDIIVGIGHDYGLQWWEQKDAVNGVRSWEKHDFEPERSQFHEIQLVDIDNDNELELVTGKRFRAHGWNDNGAKDPIGVYYYELNGGEPVRHTLDYGDYNNHAGSGIYLWVEDIDKNGWKDVVAPGKQGLYLFKNMGKAK
ncbi:MAG: VCBS repeat-containing protein [Candidatus Hydrogenedentes bacterium]|nr:VCBS repeat-containing protein [Candidatus Hydrogenedentota bacterium]